MALPRLLLIDDNKTRIQQFESVLLFLEYQVSSASSDDYISILADLNDVRAVFIGNGCEKQATLIKSVLSHVAELPVILLVEKGATLQVPSAIQKMVAECQEWPSSYPVFIETIKKLPVPKKLIVTQKIMSQTKV